MRTLFATDFDGTLFRTDRSISPVDLNALSELRLAGSVTALATGRSPFSLRRALGDTTLPIDWFILSSGAGIVSGSGRVIRSFGLTREEVAEIRGFLQAEGFDFSVQGPFPDSHILYHDSPDPHPDHLRRMGFYNGFIKPLCSLPGTATQFVVYLESSGAEEAAALIREALGGRYQLIRTTSPLDHSTVWMEVFPWGVNKGSALEFISRRLRIPIERTAALGNDWNDTQMLESAGTSFVVEGSPPGLAPDAVRVTGSDSHAVAEAVAIWRDLTK